MRPLIPVYNISYFEIQRKINRNEELYKVSDAIDKKTAARLADFYTKGFYCERSSKTACGRIWSGKDYKCFGEIGSECS